MKTLAVLVLATLATPALAGSPDLPEGKWWKHPRVAAEINLTTDQIRVIEDIFARVRPRLIDGKAELEKRQGALQEAIESNVDRRDISEKVEEVERARAELQKTRLTRMRQEYRRERRERYGRFQERHRDDRPR